MSQNKYYLLSLLISIVSGLIVGGIAWGRLAQRIDTVEPQVQQISTVKEDIAAIKVSVAQLKDDTKEINGKLDRFLIQSSLHREPNRLVSLQGGPVHNN